MDRKLHFLRLEEYKGSCQYSVSFVDATRSSKWLATLLKSLWKIKHSWDQLGFCLEPSVMAKPHVWLIEREPVQCHKQMMIADPHSHSWMRQIGTWCFWRLVWNAVLPRRGLPCLYLSAHKMHLQSKVLETQSCWKELVRRWHGIEGVSKIEVETYTLEPVFGAGKWSSLKGCWSNGCCMTSEESAMIVFFETLPKSFRWVGLICFWSVLVSPQVTTLQQVRRDSWWSPWSRVKISLRPKEIFRHLRILKPCYRKSYFSSRAGTFWKDVLEIARLEKRYSLHHSHNCRGEHDGS